MQVEVRGQTIEIEPNSRPYLLKRLVADGFDIALIFMVFTVLTMLLVRTPLAARYQANAAERKAMEEQALAESGEDETGETKAVVLDPRYEEVRFAERLHLYLLQAISAGITEGVLLLLIPLLRKDRATLGKMLTGIMPFHERKRSRIKWYQILYRFLFVLAIDSLLIYLNMEVWTFLLVPVLRLIEMLLNKNNKTILDFITGVLIIEKKSYDGLD